MKPARITTHSLSLYRTNLSILVALLLVMAMLPSNAAAAPSDINFTWSWRFGGSIIASRCAMNSFTWLTSEEISPNPRRLGSWLLPEGCQGYYAATGVARGDIIEVCIGPSDISPGDDLFRAPGTRCFRITRPDNSGNIVWEEVQPDCRRVDCTGKMADQTVCQDDAQLLVSEPILIYKRREIGRLHLYFSPSCGTNWGEVVGNSGVYDIYVSIVRKDSDVGYWHSNNDYYENGEGGTISTDMVYAPGEPVTVCGYVGSNAGGGGIDNQVCITQ